MAESHATVDDLTGWLPPGVFPDDAARLLARASSLVDHWCRAIYVTDPVTGLALESAVADALRDATCAQVEAWIEVGEENDLDGLAGGSVSIPGYSGSRAPELAPRAWRALADAGLTATSDQVVRSSW